MIFPFDAMPLSPILVRPPQRLFPGDAIGVVAPASPFDRTKFVKGLKALEEMGLETVVPDSIGLEQGYLAGPDKHRADIIIEMFTNPAVKGIICARGGYGSLRILSKLDYDAICANPKIFIGCSDITALLNTFYARCGMVSLHGPMVETLASASETTKQSLQDTLFTDTLLTLIPERGRAIFPGQASGVMAGGNLTTLCHLVGTPFQPDFSGRILLLEDVGEAPYRIDRMLTQMKLSGCFEGVVGMVLGSFKRCGEADQVDRIFTDIFSDTAIPILAGFTVGHDDPNLTVPIGLHASFDTAVGVVEFSQPPFL